MARPPDEALLGALAAKTGGSLNGAARGIWTDDRRALQEKELWPWLATLALVLFLVDVALRRWPRPASAVPVRPAASRPPEPALRS